MRALSLLILVFLDTLVVDISKVAFVLFSYDACDFIVVPEHKDIFYEMTRRDIDWTLKYQLFSGIVIYLKNVMIVDLFLLVLFWRYVRLEVTWIIRIVISISLLRLKS